MASMTAPWPERRRRSGRWPSRLEAIRTWETPYRRPSIALAPPLAPFRAGCCSSRMAGTTARPRRPRRRTSPARSASRSTPSAWARRRKPALWRLSRSARRRLPRQARRWSWREVRDTGIPNAGVRVDLLREGRRVASQTLFVTPGRQEARFPVVEKQKGFVRYAIACAPLPEETDTTHNRANIFLSVLDTRMRVLLLEGRPTWDAKFLARALRSDPAITLDCIYQLTDVKPFALRGSSDTPALTVPRAAADFSHYDVLILGKGYESFFDAPATAALKEWVTDRGGNLVFLRGRPDQNSPALADLEPLTFSSEEIEDRKS